MSEEDKLTNIEKQLIEIEILKSIYSNLNEFQIEDEDALIEAQLFVNKQDNSFNRSLGFIVHLNADIPADSEQFAQLPLEIVCRLPSKYPLNSSPNVFVRSSKLNLNRKLTEELSNFVNTSHENDCSILNIIEWIKDNVHRFLDGKNSKTESNNEVKSEKFSRMWIYSHHIYSINKRKNIVQWAKELDLNGFSKPGKPGVICVEGNQENTQEYLSKLKSLNWQRLTVKEIETFDSKTNQTQNWKKFENFEEKTFTTDSTNIDLGLFFTYLKEKNLESIFYLYFGVEGKEGIKT